MKVLSLQRQVSGNKELETGLQMLNEYYTLQRFAEELSFQGKNNKAILAKTQISFQVEKTRQTQMIKYLITFM